MWTEKPSATGQGKRMCAHRCECGLCGAPCIVAFAGKRQFMDMSNIGRRGKAKLTRLDVGLQTELPLVKL